MLLPLRQRSNEISQVLHLVEGEEVRLRLLDLAVLILPTGLTVLIKLFSTAYSSTPRTCPTMLRTVAGAKGCLAWAIPSA
jgi:hypothetical protein